MSIGSSANSVDSAVPLWRQAADSVRREITSGAVPAGTKLPSEREMSEELGISRVTARRALQALVEEGLVQSSAGRGWFAGDRPVSEPPDVLEGFSAMARSYGRAASATLLAREVRPASLEESIALGVPSGAQLLDIRRLRRLDGIAVSLDHSRIPLAHAPALADVDFRSASLYDSLARLCARYPTRAEVSVHAALADARTAAQLEVETGSPVLMYDQRTFDQHGEPIELGNIIYRGDQYRFRSTLTARG